MKFNHFVGIDVGKHEILVGILGAGEVSCRKAESFGYCVKGVSGILRLLECTGDCGEILVLMEDTGRYSERLLAALHGAGYFVWLCPPSVLSKGTLGLNRLKDDAYDARQLALVARTYHGQAERWEPLAPDVERLSRLWSRRRQIVRESVRVSNQRTSEMDGLRPDPLFVAQFDAQLSLLREQLSAIEDELGVLLCKSPGLRRKSAVLETIPGVGPQTARRVLAITRGFERIKCAKAFASYISTAPFAKSSGTSGRRTRRVSKQGDRQAKSLFYMGVASTALRKGGFWHKEYLRLTENGRQHNSAMNVIINKIIKLMFTLVRTDQKFDKRKYLENKRSGIVKKLHGS